MQHDISSHELSLCVLLVELLVVSDENRRKGSGSLLFGLSVHTPIVPERKGVVEFHIDWGWADSDFKRSIRCKLRATSSVVALSSVHVNVYCDRQTAAARCGGGAAKGVTDGLYGKVNTTVSGRLVVSVPMAAVVVVVIAMTELAVAQLIVAMLIVARNKGK
ncbi:hypothetical protein MTR67_000419 [Solanum verrucosum]|uniref:Uncharacterized protein n=1 Tax=Solanum verrucosum TaxID=315347 RepID=A0AAF0PLA4_SOLVR|nr:hypothetical protein MTR67_000419 [Solanum verrucosum]